MRARVTPANLTLSRGIALIAGLLLMSSMMILALAVGTGLLLEKRMAANFSDGQLAIQRAQLAANWGGYWLYSILENPIDPLCIESCGAVPPLFESGQLPAAIETRPQTWWHQNGQIAGIAPVSGQVKMDYSLPNLEQPRWVIEEVHSQAIEGILVEPGEHEPRLAYYRIIGRGTGRLPGSIVVTEAIIARPWIDDLAPSPFPPINESDWLCHQVPNDIPCGTLGWRQLR